MPRTWPQLLLLVCTIPWHAARAAWFYIPPMAGLFWRMSDLAPAIIRANFRLHQRLGNKGYHQLLDRLQAIARTNLLTERQVFSLVITAAIIAADFPTLDAEALGRVIDRHARMTALSSLQGSVAHAR